MAVITEKEAARWAKIREKGKWFYLARRTLVSSLVIGFAFVAANLVIGDRIEVKPMFLIFIVIAFVGTLFEWWFSDAKYQYYLLDKKIERGSIIR